MLPCRRRQYSGDFLYCVKNLFRIYYIWVMNMAHIHGTYSYDDVGVKRWLKIIRLVNMHKHLGHALAQSSLAAVLRALKTSAQVPGTQHLLRSCAMVLRLFVHTDETQSLFLAFDLYIIIIEKE